MLFTRRLLEQATGNTVAVHKATRLASFARESGIHEIADLCCGSGGDALAFAQTGLSPILCDLDPIALGLARHNLSVAGFAARTVETRLPELPFQPKLFHLDPSGTFIDCLAKAIGAASDGAEQNLKEQYHEVNALKSRLWGERVEQQI